MKFSPAAIYDLYRRGLRHPRYRWLIVGATLAYLISPVDLLPEVFPVVGVLDDAALVMLLLTELSQVALDWTRSRRSSPKASPAEDSTAPVVDVDPLP
ncbi:MAG: DUF1232 domain-containing protein [Cyanobacteria bacterium]|nr:DUF1232 domain-containing protein [Cyanobacteriota bacterium]